MSVTVMSNADGPVLCLVARDVSERANAARGLEQALKREQEAARRLRDIDEMKNTFLQAVSHDLRTPLTAILGMALTLEHEELELPAEERQDLLRRLGANARKLDRLLSDLLDVDRLSRGWWSSGGARPTSRRCCGGWWPRPTSRTTPSRWARAR